jgi:archaellin
MSILAEKKGLIIFGAILIVVLIAALAAYQMTGSMGIEDRYSQAVGLPVSGETASGFSLEGSPVLYLIVLVLLIAGCWAIYRKYAM